MGIKYGFCNDVKSRRINLGRTTLVCGTNAYIYSTDLSGTVSQSDVGSVPLSEVTDGLCMVEETGACDGVTGSFFAQSVSYNVTLQNNPMMIGCCADHITDEGKLVNSTIGGVTTSKEHQLSIDGQGEPWAVDYQKIIDAVSNARQYLSVLDTEIPVPPAGFYVPNSIDASISTDSWQQGSGNWTYFEGLGTDMVETGIMFKAQEKEYSISVNTNTGRVDGSQSITAYYTAGSSNVPCAPADVQDSVCDFAELLNTALND